MSSLPIIDEVPPAQLELNSRTPQDADFIGNPTTSLWRDPDLKKINAYAEQYYEEVVKTGQPRMTSNFEFCINNDYDLLTDIQLKFTLNRLCASPRLGFQLINHIDVVFGDRNAVLRIDYIFVDMWTQMTLSPDELGRLYRDIDGRPSATDRTKTEVTVPVYAWFYRVMTQALPLRTQLTPISFRVFLNGTIMEPAPIPVVVTDVTGGGTVDTTRAIPIQSQRFNSPIVATLDEYTEREIAAPHAYQGYLPAGPQSVAGTVDVVIPLWARFDAGFTEATAFNFSADRAVNDAPAATTTWRAQLHTGVSVDFGAGTAGAAVNGLFAGLNILAGNRASQIQALLGRYYPIPNDLRAGFGTSRIVQIQCGNAAQSSVRIGFQVVRYVTGMAPLDVESVKVYSSKVILSDSDRLAFCTSNLEYHITQTSTIVQTVEADTLSLSKELPFRLLSQGLLVTLQDTFISGRTTQALLTLTNNTIVPQGRHPFDYWESATHAGDTLSTMMLSTNGCTYRTEEAGYYFRLNTAASLPGRCFQLPAAQVRNGIYENLTSGPQGGFYIMPFEVEMTRWAPNNPFVMDFYQTKTLFLSLIRRNAPRRLSITSVERNVYITTPEGYANVKYM